MILDNIGDWFRGRLWCLPDGKPHQRPAPNIPMARSGEALRFDIEDHRDWLGVDVGFDVV